MGPCFFMLDGRCSAACHTTGQQECPTCPASFDPLEMVILTTSNIHLSFFLRHFSSTDWAIINLKNNFQGTCNTSAFDLLDFDYYQLSALSIQFCVMFILA